MNLFSSREISGNDSAELIRLADFYKDRGSAEDLNKAFQCLQAAEHLGDVACLSRMAVCYEYGLGVQENKCLAFHYYERAAQNGRAEDMYYLGLCYKDKIGVEEDPLLFALCMDVAAKKRNVDAIFSLAECYETGYGVPIDHYKACELYRKLASGSNLNKNVELQQIAKERLEKLITANNPLYISSSSDGRLVLFAEEKKIPLARASTTFFQASKQPIIDLTEENKQLYLSGLSSNDASPR